jgi:hypothetical protein
VDFLNFNYFLETWETFPDLPGNFWLVKPPEVPEIFTGFQEIALNKIFPIVPGI